MLVRALRGVLYLSDTPHRIAMGCAAGLFVMPLPLPGQMVLGPMLARLLGGNMFASIPWTWVNNPFTVLFFIYGQYRLGLWFVPGHGEVLSFAGLAELVERFNHLPWSEALHHGVEVFGGILLPLALGSVIAALVGAVGGYFFIRRLVIRAQMRKKIRHAVWQRGGTSILGGDNGVGADTRHKP
jgi:uncharacterized protein